MALCAERTKDDSELAMLESLRAEKMGGSLWTSMPAYAPRELQRAKQDYYNVGLCSEMLADFERANGLAPDRSEKMLAAAGMLLASALPLVGGFNALTPPRLVTSRPCGLFIRCDLEPTMNAAPAAFGTVPPTLFLFGNLSQRIGLRGEIDSLGTGALGSTTLKFSYNNGATFSVTGFVTTGAITAIGDTGIYVACSAGPYSADNAWEGYLGALGDQVSSGDFVNGNTSTSFSYQASNTSIRNRASMQSLASRSARFTSTYAPPIPSVYSWVGNAVAHVHTGRIIAGGNLGNTQIRQANPSPECAMSGNVAVNNTAAMTVGTWLGCEAYFSNSVADRFRVGTTNIALGVSANCDPNIGLSLGARLGGNLPSTYAFSEFAVFTGGDLSAADLSRLRSYKFLTYGCAA